MYRKLFIIVGFFVTAIVPSYTLAQSASPYRIDMIVEADTVVPPFYSGRSLPTNGSLVTVTALPSFKQTVSPLNYRYIWTQDGKVQNGGTAMKSNSFSFTPTLQNQVSVGVTITNQSGTSLAEHSQVITLIDPEVYFYEKNPLRGLIPKALPAVFTALSEETTIRAEGYFMNKAIAPQNLFIEWDLNGTPITPTSDPYEITLTQEGAGGHANVTFAVRNMKSLLQGAVRSITVRF